MVASIFLVSDTIVSQQYIYVIYQKKLEIMLKLISFFMQ